MTSPVSSKAVAVKLANSGDTAFGIAVILSIVADSLRRILVCTPCAHHFQRIVSACGILITPVFEVQ